MFGLVYHICTPYIYNCSGSLPTRHSRVRLSLPRLTLYNQITNCNSELRMVSAVVDEHGDGVTLPKAFRLKAAYVNDPKRMEQVLDTFPMSSVLKKVPHLGIYAPAPSILFVLRAYFGLSDE